VVTSARQVVEAVRAARRGLTSARRRAERWTLRPSSACGIDGSC